MGWEGFGRIDFDHDNTGFFSTKPMPFVQADLGSIGDFCEYDIVPSERSQHEGDSYPMDGYRKSGPKHSIDFLLDYQGQVIFVDILAPWHTPEGDPWCGTQDSFDEGDERLTYLDLRTETFETELDSTGQMNLLIDVPVRRTAFVDVFDCGPECYSIRGPVRVRGGGYIQQYFIIELVPVNVLSNSHLQQSYECHLKTANTVASFLKPIYCAIF